MYSVLVDCHPHNVILRYLHQNGRGRQGCSFTESFGQDRICCAASLPVNTSQSETVGSGTSDMRYINKESSEPCQYKSPENYRIRVDYTYDITDTYSNGSGTFAGPFLHTRII